MQELTDFNKEKNTKEILILKEELNKNIKELNKYGITLENVLKEMEEQTNG